MWGCGQWNLAAVWSWYCPFSLSSLSNCFSRHKRASGIRGLGVWISQTSVSRICTSAPNKNLYTQVQKPLWKSRPLNHPVRVESATGDFAKELMEMWGKVNRQNNCSAQTRPFSRFFECWNCGFNLNANGIFNLNALNPEEWKTRKCGIGEDKSIKINKQSRLHEKEKKCWTKKEKD